MRALTQLTDQQLIHLFIDGESEALEMIFNRHKEKIFTSIFLLVKDKYVAEDIFQDVFIRVIDTVRSGRYTEEGKFLPWAMRIAHNLCVDHFRKVKRTPTVRSSEDQDIFEMLNMSEDGIDRKVIILRHYAELSFKEIAALTNCSINTALGRMRYGLINLRKMMNEKKISL
jgi:DNA-directed RNA polymerase specialized sigma24 family protein